MKVNVSFNGELKKVLGQVKKAQSQLQSYLQGGLIFDEARRYAEKQGKELRKMFNGDVGKVRTLVERQRKELERFQKQIPGEVAKLRKFVGSQRKELEKLLKKVRKTPKKPARRKAASK